jgi:MFS family permease
MRLRQGLPAVMVRRLMTTADPTLEPTPPSETRALLEQRSFMFLLAGRFTAAVGVQVQTVNIGWQVYTLAREGRTVKEAAFILSMIGLVQFLPVLFLTLVAGQAADHYNRRNIVVISLACDIVSTTALGVIAWVHPLLWPIFVVAAAFGASRAFLSPASGAMAPMLVSRAQMPRALAWSSLAWQSASVLGPALGGLIIGPLPTALNQVFHLGQTPAQTAHLGIIYAYCTSGGLYVLSIACLMMIRDNTTPEHNAASRWAMVKEGLAYVWNQKIVFGAISLDLFAVLLGGATLLLPAFAADVLHVGPQGFGLLRAAPGAGAAVVAIWLAANPVRRHAGVIMFSGVAVFSLATILFGAAQPLTTALGIASLAPALSVFALAALGGADMLSVYVRQTLVQIVTPNAMRGRVSAVSSLFIGASNELGEFESGLVARVLGPVGAAIFGGVGALIVTGVWSRLFPALRQADSLSGD